ncbi:hypothetical protein AT157_gp2 [Daeseongdong virus 1]|uniref:hypothetical protein n=1 Tax=Daeseongdong virus 1 TaxID=1758881 RepID=UPI00071AE09C|nr:hypothetical protein AT157_gp2 [Daeseongdong virus 1]ALP32037.1 hypothetical protein [Daeseongdong virus 1]
MKSFLLFVLFLTTSVHAAVFIKDIVRQLTATREKHLLYSKLQMRLHFVGEFDISPYKFDPECLSVYRTNDWFFSKCELPSNCSKPLVDVIDRNWLGQETVLCHGVHPSETSDRMNFFSMEFVPSNFTFGRPITIDGREFTRFEDFVPVSFFEWFYMVKSPGDSYGIVPKFCSETYRDSTTLPPNVNVKSDGNTLCLTEIQYDQSDCRPKWYPSYHSIFADIDFPVEFSGVPYSPGSYSATNNKVIGADVYMKDNLGNTPTHVIDKVGGAYMVTYSPYNGLGPIYIVKATSVIPKGDSRCFELQSRYHSPFEILIAKISKFFRQELEYLLEFLIAFAEKIASILIAILGEIMNVVLSLVPYGDLFYTSAFLAAVTYLFTRDVILALVPNIAIYLVRIYLKSAI